MSREIVLKGKNKGNQQLKIKSKEQKAEEAKKLKMRNASKKKFEVLVAKMDPICGNKKYF